MLSGNVDGVVPLPQRYVAPKVAKLCPLLVGEVRLARSKGLTWTYEPRVGYLLPESRTRDLILHEPFGEEPRVLQADEGSHIRIDLASG